MSTFNEIWFYTQAKLSTSALTNILRILTMILTTEAPVALTNQDFVTWLAK